MADNNSNVPIENGKGQFKIVEVNAGEIDLTECVRKDLGDIKGLAKSIKEIGLLQFLVLSPGKKLVAGRRRYEAMVKELGISKIPCYVCDSMKSAKNRAEAQDAENTHRKKWSPHEALEIYNKRFPGAQKEAKERQKTKSAKKTEQGDARNVAAAETGVSAATIRKIKAVCDAAATNSALKPIEEEMEKSGNVTAAYDKIKGEKPKKEKNSIDIAKAQIMALGKIGVLWSDLVRKEHLTYEFKEALRNIAQALNMLKSSYNA